MPLLVSALIIGGAVLASAGISAGVALSRDEPDFPGPEDPSVQEAARRQRLAGASASRGGTLLTSGAGLEEDTLLGRRTLLGQ